MSKEVQEVEKEVQKEKAKGFFASATDSALSFFDGPRGFNTTQLAVTNAVMQVADVSPPVKAAVMAATEFGPNYAYQRQGQGSD